LRIWELRTAQEGSSAIADEMELAATDVRSKNRRPERAFIISPLDLCNDLSTEEADIRRHQGVSMQETIKVNKTPCTFAGMKHGRNLPFALKNGAETLWRE
jgi:hypothetical protein